jgi:hypothetical protein
MEVTPVKSVTDAADCHDAAAAENSTRKTIEAADQLVTPVRMTGSSLGAPISA